jgi:hypothetical protein
MHSEWRSPDSQSVAEARSVSRPGEARCVTRSQSLDTDLCGLGVSFIYPGNVRFSCNTVPLLFDLRILATGNSAKFSHR